MRGRNRIAAARFRPGLWFRAGVIWYAVGNVKLGREVMLATQERLAMNRQTLDYSVARSRGMLALLRAIRVMVVLIHGIFLLLLPFFLTAFSPVVAVCLMAVVVPSVAAMAGIADRRLLNIQQVYPNARFSRGGFATGVVIGCLLFAAIYPGKRQEYVACASMAGYRMAMAGVVEDCRRLANERGGAWPDELDSTVSSIIVGREGPVLVLDTKRFDGNSLPLKVDYLRPGATDADDKTVLTSREPIRGTGYALARKNGIVVFSEDKGRARASTSRP